MPRRKDPDYPGAWHHVMNRGVARRPVFEEEPDVRCFGEALDRVSRAGLLEVHAFVFMTTHFHLLVRSPTGRLSDALGRVQNRFVRTFNRERGRDGSLFRARFGSRVIEDDAYWETVLRYVDLNPVTAGLVSSPSDYPHGSAYHYVRGGSPAWLVRSEVEETIARAGLDASRYDQFALDANADAIRHIAEASDRGPSDVRRLLSDPPEHVRRWLVRNAERADGRQERRTVVDPALLRMGIAGFAKELAAVDPGTGRVDVRSTMEPGLLRQASGLGNEQIAEVLELPLSTVRGRTVLHRRRLLSSTTYGRLAGELLQDVVRRTVRAPARRVVTGRAGA